MANKRLSAVLVVLALVAVMFTAGASAQTSTWNPPSGNDTWNLGTNWSPSGIPGSAGTAQFTGARPDANTPDLGSGATVGSILFAGSSTGYKIQNGTLTVMTSITQASSGVNRIDSNIVLGSSGSINVTNGSLRLTGANSQLAARINISNAQLNVTGNNTNSSMGTGAVTLGSGGTLSIAALGGYIPGLDIRAWGNSGGTTDIDGARFSMTAPNPVPTASTYAGTLGYATQSINMNGNDQEHFGTGNNSGVPDSSPLRPTGYQNNYEVEYRGEIYIATAGTYRFATTSDDGSALWIDPSTDNPTYGTAAVQNSYLQGMTTRYSNQDVLTAGYHQIIVRYYEVGGGNGLDVQWDPTGGTNFVAIPGADFFHGTLAQSVQAGNAVSVTGNSTINATSPVPTTLGALQMQRGTTLSLGGGVTFTGTTFSGPVGGTATFNTTAAGTTSNLGLVSDGGVTTVFVKDGPGNLLANTPGNQFDASSTIRVKQGSLTLLSSDVASGAGAATLELAGGTLILQGTQVITNAPGLSASYFNFQNDAYHTLTGTYTNVVNGTFTGAGGLLAQTPFYRGSAAGVWNYQDTGAYTHANIFPGLGMNGLSDSGAYRDNYMILWTGTYTPSATGNYTFIGAADDVCSMWMDTNRDGAFEAGENVGGIAGNTNGTVSLTAGTPYNVAFTYREGGGGDWSHWQVTTPSSGTVDLMAAGNGTGVEGTWTHLASTTLTSNMGNAVHVTATGSTLDADTAYYLNLGDLTIDHGMTLNVLPSQPTGIVRFTSTTLGGDATLNVTGTMYAGAYTDGSAGTRGTSLLTKTGSGTLVFDDQDPYANTDGGTTIDIQNGSVNVQGFGSAAGAQACMPSASYILESGGRLVMSSAQAGKIVLINNSITVTGTGGALVASKFGENDNPGSSTSLVTVKRTVPLVIGTSSATSLTLEADGFYKLWLTAAAGLSGPGNLIKTGDSTVTLDNVSYTGTTTLQSGTLIINDSIVAGETSGITINGGTGQFTSAAGVNTSGGPVVVNAGTMTVTGSLRAGDTTVNNGTLTANSTVAAGQVTVNNTGTFHSVGVATVGGLNVNNSGTANFNTDLGITATGITTTGGTTTVTGNISAPGQPISVYSGQVTANGTINAGSLSVSGGRMVAKGALTLGWASLGGTGILDINQPNIMANVPDFTVSGTSWLSLDQPQTVMPAITINAGAAVTGDTSLLTGLMRGADDPQGARLIFQSGAAFGSLAGQPQPTTDDLGSVRLVRAIVANDTGSYILGDDSGPGGANGINDIYTGAVFGLWSRNTWTDGQTANFQATLTEGTPGQGLQINMAGQNVPVVTAATLNTTNTAIGANFYGAGNLMLNNAPSGTWRVLSRTGDPTTLNTTILSLGAGAIPSGKTLKVTDGWVYPSADNFMAASNSDIQIGAGAALYLQDHSSIGTYDILADGLVNTGDKVNRLNQAGTTWHWAPNTVTVDPVTGSREVLPGAMLAIHQQNFDLISDGFPLNVQYIMDEQGSTKTWAMGFPVADGSLITGRTDDNTDFDGGIGIVAAPGAPAGGTVGFDEPYQNTNPTEWWWQRFMSFYDPVDLRVRDANKQLIAGGGALNAVFGNANMVDTITGNWNLTRWTMAMSGHYEVRATFLANDIQVQSGLLDINIDQADQTADGLSGMFRVNNIYGWGGYVPDSPSTNGYWHGGSDMVIEKINNFNVGGRSIAGSIYWRGQYLEIYGYNSGMGQAMEVDPAGPNAANAFANSIVIGSNSRILIHPIAGTDPSPNIGWTRGNWDWDNWYQTTQGQVTTIRTPIVIEPDQGGWGYGWNVGVQYSGGGSGSSWVLFNNVIMEPGATLSVAEEWGNNGTSYATFNLNLQGDALTSTRRTGYIDQNASDWIILNNVQNVSGTGQAVTLNVGEVGQNYTRDWIDGHVGSAAAPVNFNIQNGRVIFAPSGSYAANGTYTPAGSYDPSTQFTLSNNGGVELYYQNHTGGGQDGPFYTNTTKFTVVGSGDPSTYDGEIRVSGNNGGGNPWFVTYLKNIHLTNDGRLGFMEYAGRIVADITLDGDGQLDHRNIGDDSLAIHNVTSGTGQNQVLTLTTLPGQQWNNRWMLMGSLQPNVEVKVENNLGNGVFLDSVADDNQDPITNNAGRFPGIGAAYGFTHFNLNGGTLTLDDGARTWVRCDPGQGVINMNGITPAEATAVWGNSNEAIYDGLRFEQAATGGTWGNGLTVNLFDSRYVHFLVNGGTTQNFNGTLRIMPNSLGTLGYEGDGTLTMANVALTSGSTLDLLRNNNGTLRITGVTLEGNGTLTDTSSAAMQLGGITGPYTVSFSDGATNRFTVTGPVNVGGIVIGAGTMGVTFGSSVTANTAVLGAGSDLISFGGPVHIGAATFGGNLNLDALVVSLGSGTVTGSAKVNSSKVTNATAWTVAGTRNAQLTLTGHNAIDTAQSLTLGGGTMVLRLNGDATVGAPTAASLTINPSAAGQGASVLDLDRETSAGGTGRTLTFGPLTMAGGSVNVLTGHNYNVAFGDVSVTGSSSTMSLLSAGTNATFGAVNFSGGNQALSINGNNSVVRLGALSGGAGSNVATLAFGGGTLHLSPSPNWFGLASIDNTGDVLAVDADLSSFYHNNGATILVSDGAMTDVTYEAPQGTTSTLAGVETWSLQLSSSMNGITGPAGAFTDDGSLPGELILNTTRVDPSFRQAAPGGGTQPLKMADGSLGWTMAVIRSVQTGSEFAAPLTITGATTLGDASGNGKNFSLTGIIDGVGSFTKVGGETVTLGGANTFQGNTLISGGEVVMGNAQAFGAAGNVITVDGGGSTLGINAPANFGPGGYSLVLETGSVVEVLADGVNLASVPQIGPTDTLKLSMHSGTAPTSTVLGTTILNTTSLDSSYVLGLSGTILANVPFTVVSAVADKGNTNFQIAAGNEIYMLSSAAFTLNGSRTWDISSGASSTAGVLDVEGNITAAPGVVLTKTGPGTLILGGTIPLPKLVVGNSPGGVVQITGAAPSSVVIHAGSLYTVDQADYNYSEVDAANSGGIVALSQSVTNPLTTIDFSTNATTLSLGAYQDTQTFGGTLLPGDKFRFGGGNGTLMITSPLSAGKDAQFGWVSPGGNDPQPMGMTVVNAATALNRNVNIYQPVQIANIAAFANVAGAYKVNVQPGGMLDFGDVINPDTSVDHSALLANIKMLGGAVSNNDLGNWPSGGPGLTADDCNVLFGAGTSTTYVFGTNFSGSTSIGSPLTNTGGLTKVGTSDIVLGYDEQYSGPTIVKGGSLTAASTSSFGGSTDINVWPNASLYINDTDTGILNAQVTLGGTMSSQVPIAIQAPDISHSALVMNGGSPTINVVGMFNTVSVGKVNDLGQPVTLNKIGPGTLAMTDVSGTSSMSSTTIRVTEGTLTGVNTPTTSSLGNALIALNGGTLQLTGSSFVQSAGLAVSYFNFNNDAYHTLTGSYTVVGNTTFTGTGGLLAQTSLFQGVATGVWNYQDQGTYTHAVLFPGSGMDGSNDGGAYRSNYMILWTGTFTPAASGNYNFMGAADDVCSLWIDSNNDGAFEAGENVGGINWNTNGTVNLTAGTAYNVAFTYREGNGGDWSHWWVNTPNAGQVDLMAAGNGTGVEGTWTHLTGSGTPNYGNDVRVESSSTLQVVQNGAVAMGNLIVDGNADLTVNGTASFTGVLTAAAGQLGINTAVAGTNVSLGQVNDGGLATTLVKKGPAQLVLSPMSGATMTNTSFRLEGGTITVQTSATANGLGSRPVTLAGDGTTLQLVGVNPLPAPLRYYTFDDPTNLLKDSSGNGSGGWAYAGATYSPNGKEGGALYLPNRTSEVFTQLYGVAMPANYTISAWFSDMDGQSTGDWRTLFRGWANDNQIILQQNSDVLGWYNNNGGGFQAATTPGGDQVHTAGLVGSSGWDQMTVVGTGGNSYFYIDGVYVGVAPGQSATDLFCIGNYQGGTQRFAQYIDDVALFGSALTADQVGALYTGGLSGVATRDIGSDLNVTANAEVNITGGVLMGKATIDDGKTLSVTGGNVLRLAGTAVGAMGGSSSAIGINTAAAMTVYAGAYTGDTRGTTLIKTGPGALIFDEVNAPTTDTNTLVDIQGGTVGVLMYGKFNQPNFGALPNASFQIGGGSSLIMSVGSPDNVNFNNPINVINTGGKLMFAEYGENAVAGPVTVTRPLGTDIPAGATLEIGVANGYILNNIGPITGGGNVLIQSGGLMNFTDITIGGLAISGGTQVNLNGQLTMASPAGFSLTGGGMLLINASNGLAGMAGQFEVGTGGNQQAWLKLAAPQAGFTGTVKVLAGSALTGDTTGLTVIGATGSDPLSSFGGTVVLANNAIFAPVPNADPTVAQLGSGVRLQAAMIGGEANRVINVSASGGAAPYTNAIYGPWSRTDPLDPTTVRQFIGTINDVDGGGIAIKLNGASTVLDSTATLNSPTGVTFTGPGQLSVPTAIGGSATNFAFQGTFATMATDAVTLGAGAIPAGTTYTIGMGQAVLAGGGAVLPSHTSSLTVQNGGFVSIAGMSMTHGTYNVQPGGMVWIGNSSTAFNMPNTDVTWNWSPGVPTLNPTTNERSITPGAILAFQAQGFDPSANNWPNNVEFLMGSWADSGQWPNGFPLGNGAYIVGSMTDNLCPAYNNNMGLIAAANAQVGDAVGLAMPFYSPNPTDWMNRNLQLQDTMDLRIGRTGGPSNAMDLVIGNQNRMWTILGDGVTTQALVPMSGQIDVQATLIARNVDIESGMLHFEIQNDRTAGGVVPTETLQVNNIYAWGGYRPDDGDFTTWHGGANLVFQRINNFNTPTRSIAGSVYFRGGLMQITADSDNLTYALEQDPATNPAGAFANQIVLGSDSRLELMPRGSAAASSLQPWDSTQSCFNIQEPIVIEKDNGDWRYGYNVILHREGADNAGNNGNDIYLANVIMENGATLAMNWWNANQDTVNLTLQGNALMTFRNQGNLNAQGLPYLGQGSQWSGLYNVVSDGSAGSHTLTLGERGMSDVGIWLRGQIGTPGNPVTAQIIGADVQFWGGSIAAGSVLDDRGVNFNPAGFGDAYIEMYGGVEGGVSYPDAGGKILLSSGEDIRSYVDGTLNNGMTRVNTIAGRIEIVPDNVVGNYDGSLEGQRVYNVATRVTVFYKNVKVDDGAIVHFIDRDSTDFITNLQSDPGGTGTVYHDGNQFRYGDIGPGSILFTGNQSALFIGAVLPGGELIWDIGGQHWDGVLNQNVNNMPIFTTQNDPNLRLNGTDLGFTQFHLAGGTLNMAQQTLTLTGSDVNGTDIGTGTLKTSGTGTIVVAGQAAIPNVTGLVVAGGTMRLQSNIADTWAQPISVIGGASGTLQVGPVATDGSVTGLTQTFSQPLVFKNGTTPALNIIGVGSYTVSFPSVDVQATAGAASLSTQIPNMNLGPVSIAGTSSLTVGTSSGGSAKITTVTGPVGSGFAVGPAFNSDVTITGTAANFFGTGNITGGTLRMGVPNAGTNLAFNGSMKNNGTLQVTAGNTADFGTTMIASDGSIQMFRNLLGGSVNAGGLDTAVANPGNFGLSGSVLAMARSAGNGNPASSAADALWCAARGDGSGSGPNNTEIIYTGQIYLPAGQTSFLMMGDDCDYLAINSVQLINDGNWSSPDYGSFTNTTGSAAWFSFDLRCQNGGGGYGFNGQGGGNWGNATSGFLMKVGSGGAGDDPTTYSVPAGTPPTMIDVQGSATLKIGGFTNHDQVTVESTGLLTLQNALPSDCKNLTLDGTMDIGSATVTVGTGAMTGALLGNGGTAAFTTLAINGSAPSVNLGSTGHLTATTANINSPFSFNGGNKATIGTVNVAASPVTVNADAALNATTVNVAAGANLAVNGGNTTAGLLAVAAGGNLSVNGGVNNITQVNIAKGATMALNNAGNQNGVAAIQNLGTVTATAGVTDLSNTMITSTKTIVTPIGLDIGSPGLAGSWSYNASTGAYTVTGGGSDIWGASDQFYYLYATTPANEDITMTARVVSLGTYNPSTGITTPGGPDGWTKAGVMIRDTTYAGSTHGFEAVTQSNGVNQQGREATDGQSDNNQAGGLSAPMWVKITRSAATGQVMGYYSTDGINWIQNTTNTPAMSSTDILMGLAVTAHNNGALASAVIDNFSGFGTVLPGDIAVADGATLMLKGFTSANNVSLAGTGKLQLKGSDWSDCINLALDSGSNIDIGKSGLKVTSGVLSDVVGEIASGQITSNQIDGSNPDNRLAAGVLPDGSVAVKATIMGDADMDGTVGPSDLALLEANFGPTTLGWTAGDFNGDGVVDWMDYLTLKAYMGRTFQGTGAVPEPATLGLLAFGLGGLLLKRRNRK